MRIGCCGGIEQAAEVRAAGFDFLEVNVQTVLQGDLPDDQWRRTAPDPAKLPLPIEAANCLVPGNHPLLGPKRDLKALKIYLQRVAERAQRLGISRLVFGSGGARRRPDDLAPDAVAPQLAEFVRLAGDVCGRHGIVLTIEHLNAGETNTVNKLAQALSLCDLVASRDEHSNTVQVVLGNKGGLQGDVTVRFHGLDKTAYLREGDRIHVVVERIPEDKGGPVAAVQTVIDARLSIRDNTLDVTIPWTSDRDAFAVRLGPGRP